jgi:hypothetical protein
LKSINLDSLPVYTKQELAEHQLDKAIQLLLDENDPICAITLAGAAEEILGKLVELEGKKHSLKQFIELCLATGSQLDKDWKPKDFANFANFYRNELKHYVDGSEITVSPECACEIIDRAVENLWQVTGRQSNQVLRYMIEVHSK